MKRATVKKCIKKSMKESIFDFTEEDCILLKEGDKIWVSFINEEEGESIFRQKVFEEKPDENPWGCQYFVMGEVIEEISNKIKNPLKMNHALSNIMQLIHFRIGNRLQDIKVLKTYMQLDRKLIKGKIFLLELKNKEHLFIFMK